MIDSRQHRMIMTGGHRFMERPNGYDVIAYVLSAAHED